MNATLIMIIGLGVLSLASGMLGLGVAFSAVPFLAFFLPDLVHQVQPLSLLLNGITALFAVFGFAQSGYVDWKKAIPLAVVTTVSAPFGAWFVQYTPVMYVWFAYLLSVIFIAYRLFRPVQARPGEENFKLALILSVSNLTRELDERRRQYAEEIDNYGRIYYHYAGKRLPGRGRQRVLLRAYGSGIH